MNPPAVVNIQSWIHLHDGFWGDWGRVSFCGENKYSLNTDGKGSKDFIGRPAYGFLLRIEEQQGAGDDTALNGLKIICKNDELLTVQEGEWGGGWYGPTYCGGGRFFTGAVVRVEKSQGAGDDTAMNTVQFACGYNNRPGKADDWSNWDVQKSSLVEGYWGDWQQWKWCPYNSYICGFQVRFEVPQGAGDDTAFNGLKIVCCYWPSGSG
ncbi:hypothetical protein GPECTOR_24g268 [Gonium pectorale]|uniref:Vitelline membrane outer layer protein 1 homolog n=1 Tax=Gonium pectorale TaxID=33097 RepID=A0A150GGM4_GONPE|nr:hypothetical protein GPECTOR_24g268 [Gonium pectorale]|eukprot:KXZ48978.1 hypothetical protein GPECTOR_24g268 [Gonium pectorale]